MEIKFIKDEVFFLNKEKDLLGTLPYSNTLFSIIKNTSGKRNIGLFGSWGSGKSTILNTLKTQIEKHNEDVVNKTNRVAYFEFDAWKYSRDDFRRSFILEFKETFEDNIVATKKLRELLYSETTVEDPKKTQFKFNRFALSDWIILLFAVLAILFIIFPIMDTPEERVAKNIITLIFFLVTLLSTALKNTITKYKVVVKENKLIEPERFEQIFKETVDGITDNKTNSVKNWIRKLINSRASFSKIVIVIDNLDRCDDENLMVTLNTIKNFLEHDKVIFVLPVDEKGVSAFLANKTDNPDEYLRKIFHLIIRLKEFSRRELFEFTNKLNENYQLNLTFKSIRLICQEFTGNPRKIIQFLNNYQSEMKLIEEQSILGYINKAYIHENLNFFIKILIIKYEWRHLYNQILYDKTILNKISNQITQLKINDNNLYPIKGVKVNLTDEQRNFFYSTQDIHCSKIDPFVQNIDLDIDIPDEINDFIRYANYDRIINYLTDKNAAFNITDLLQKMNELYGEFTYKRMEYSLIAIPLLDLLFKFVLDKNQDDFRNELIANHSHYGFINSLTQNSEIKELYDNFLFQTVSLAVKWFSENINDNLYNSFKAFFEIRHLSDSQHDNEQENIEFFIQTFKDNEKLNDLQSLFGKKLVAKPQISKLESLKDFSISSQLINDETCNEISRGLIAKKFEGVLQYRMEDIALNHFKNSERNIQLQCNLCKHFLIELEGLYDTEKGIAENVHVDYQDYFEKLSLLLIGSKNVELSDSFKEKLRSINNYFLELYDEDFDDEKHFELYGDYFEFIQSLIFYALDFNNVSYRKEFFEDFLNKCYSNKILLKINSLLYKDVKKFAPYNYPFADTLIGYYNYSKDHNFGYSEQMEFAKTLLLMVKKTNDKVGLSNIQIESIFNRGVVLYSIYSHNQESVENLMKLKELNSTKLLSAINNKAVGSNFRYIKHVKKLNDHWFYGDSGYHYLNEFLNGSERRRSTFFSKLKETFDILPIEIQIKTIEELISNFDIVSYKWLRLSYRVLDKAVFDVYVKKLLESYKNDLIDHNHFFKWICDIPKTQFLKKTCDEYRAFLSSLTINHKTYSSKKDKALKHLEK
ncbi:KAP family P-loop NTPase fold protein [Xanthomarina gelatinilytica]|uniref:KAP family P-loop NTPase fold protein n=1 Tax=Xanthomarina gelatinilytica TaxID=1137281 RepID=UPI003AA9595E